MFSSFDKSACYFGRGPWKVKQIHWESQSEGTSSVAIWKSDSNRWWSCFKWWKHLQCFKNVGFVPECQTCASWPGLVIQERVWSQRLCVLVIQVTKQSPCSNYIVININAIFFELLIAMASNLLAMASNPLVIQVTKHKVHSTSHSEKTSL